MNRYAFAMSNLMLGSCLAFCSVVFIYQVYAFGYTTGIRQSRYVKNRLVKEGNILQYPFRKKCGEANQTSNSNSPQQSGQEPETA